jgi:hypothetical protein
LANWTDLGGDLVGSSLVLKSEYRDQGEESAIACDEAGGRGGLVVTVMEKAYPGQRRRSRDLNRIGPTL